MIATELYFEAHVTIDPVQDHRRLREWRVICDQYGFRPANLLMQKGETLEPSDLDCFCTARGDNYQRLADQTGGVVRELKGAGFGVRRYKIENTIVDSRSFDTLALLS